MEALEKKQIEEMQTRLRGKAEEMSRSQDLATANLRTLDVKLDTAKKTTDNLRQKFADLTKEKEMLQIERKGQDDALGRLISDKQLLANAVSACDQNIEALAREKELLEDQLSFAKGEILKIQGETQVAIYIFTQEPVMRYTDRHDLPAPEYNDDDVSGLSSGEEEVDSQGEILGDSVTLTTSEAQPSAPKATPAIVEVAITCPVSPDPSNIEEISISEPGTISAAENPEAGSNPCEMVDNSRIVEATPSSSLDDA